MAYTQVILALACITAFPMGTSGDVFDCYLTENWDTDGIIQFNGCAGKFKNLGSHHRENIEFCVCKKY